MHFLYLLLSLMALLLTFVFFWFGRHPLSTSSLYLWLAFFGLLGINLIEFLSFYFIGATNKQVAVLTIYYIFAEIAFIAFFALSLQNANKLSGRLKVLLGMLFVFGMLPFLMPGAALVGAESIGDSIVGVAGPYYWVAQLSILISIFGALLVSGYFSFFSDDSEVRRKSRVQMLAISPLLVAVFIVLVLIQLRFQVNASLILSSAATITLFILLANESKAPIFNFIDKVVRHKLDGQIPKSHNKSFIDSMVSLVTNPSIGLEQGRDLIEQEMIREALVLAGDNKMKASEMLGISPQVLNRRLGRQRKETSNSDK